MLHWPPRSLDGQDRGGKVAQEALEPQGIASGRAHGAIPWVLELSGRSSRRTHELGREDASGIRSSQASEPVDQPSSHDRDEAHEELRQQAMAAERSRPGLRATSQAKGAITRAAATMRAVRATEALAAKAADPPLEGHREEDRVDDGAERWCRGPRPETQTSETG